MGVVVLDGEFKEIEEILMNVVYFFNVAKEVFVSAGIFDKGL